MTNKTLNKIILSATTAMFLTACGGGGSSTPTAKDKAMAVIKAYADDGKTAPILADYTAAGVTGVTAANLAAMNQLVESKTGDEVDELSELTTLAGEVDTEAPVITLTGSATVDLVVGAAYTEAGATVTDNKDTALTATIAGVVNTATAGTYTVTYNVTDTAGNDAVEVTRTVNVTVAPVADTERPVITLIGSSTVDLVVGDTYVEAGATVTDNKDTGLTAKIDASAVTIATAGTYVVTYNVSDAAHNAATEVTRTVIVHDTQFIATNGEVKDIIRGLTWKNEVTATCPAGFAVPTVEQFQTIIDYSKDYTANTNTMALLVSGFDANLTGNAQTSNGDVDIHRGSVNKTRAATKTICVKGTWTPAADSFTRDDGNNTVKDNNTGLVWSDDSSTTTVLKTFAEANATCDGIGMKLPTLVELDSIYNRTENNISSGFTKGIAAGYWSTTPIIGETTPHQWTVNFNDTNSSLEGQIYGMVKTTQAYVRCVK